jgi:hypothetical protein
MKAIKITAEEFNSIEIQRRGGGHPVSPLGLALRDVQPGEGFKLPCTYKHRSYLQNAITCSGISSAHGTANRHGFKVTCKCKNGILYIMRKVAA